MIYSMTGYAVQQREIGRAVVHLELRSVNSRYLDLVFRVADDLRQFEPQLREILGARLARGKLECRLNLQVDAAAGTPQLALNHALLGQLREAEAAVRAELPEAGGLSVAEVLRWPGMLGEQRIDIDTLRPLVGELTEAALDDFVASREREGGKLAAAIRERIDGMRALVARVAPRIPEVVADYRARVTARLREAVDTLDDERIRQEVAVFAQRVDVDEELSRLAAHLDEVERILDAKGPAGKRLDFLMQELNREANTLASKSAAGDVSAAAMEMKLLIEQMREQVQNIE
ncbi:YicC/YloC family endoribonuclease [Pseudazoarcus pumilus]|uniref:YicC family protein n=1 Tax=Pseudazoarcus pumilus TaxID=2067960 RepID=A0A2I6S2Z1_9RHOO|nr:YicC/YloC family endoribonuclease [Pseudazoarcus pumilus]AUN93636.1 YicC family protein [Pseudazoarcus pumilus]